MAANRGEDPTQLGRRYDRYKVLLSFNDLWTKADKRAFLMTPREEFVLPEDKDNAYVGHYLDIGFGVTITPPGTMGRMTSALNIRASDKVLEIGTGSGFQSALLTYLTPHVHSIEIIPELAARTRGVYDRLIGAGYREYSAITTRSGDGYYGWEEAAPFDKIIVTCGIDHIPPPLLQQLKPTGSWSFPWVRPGRSISSRWSRRSARTAPFRSRARTFSAARSFRSCRCPAATRARAEHAPVGMRDAIRAPRGMLEAR